MKDGEMVGKMEVVIRNYFLVYIICDIQNTEKHLTFEDQVTKKPKTGTLANSEDLDEMPHDQSPEKEI